MRVRYIAIILLTVILAACSSAARSSLLTKTPQSMLIPTFTEVPITSTPGPENTPSFTATINVNLGVPVSDWKGIPVMPGATKGEIKAFGYMYWVNVTAEEVEAFYTEQMKLNGWPFVKHANVLSWYGRGELLHFKQEYSNEFVDVIFIVDPEDNCMMVAIKKYIYNP